MKESMGRTIPTIGNVNGPKRMGGLDRAGHRSTQQPS